MRVFTVGHSTTDVADLIERLSHQVDVVTDVRTVPYSSRAPQFNREPLTGSLQEAGLRYVFLGSELGGRPSNDMRGGDGRANYDQMAQAPSFQRGLARLLDGAGRFRVAMLCSEGKHDACHRWLLVGRVLVRDHAVDVVHIQPDGTLKVEPPELTAPLGVSKKPVPSG